MHSTFRTIGQQMGLQLIRGILPESIDVYLNSAIIGLVRSELIESVKLNLQMESKLSNVSTMSKINTFNTLFRNVRYSITSEENDSMSFKTEYFSKKYGYYIINIPTVNSNVPIKDNEYYINPMMYLNFNVEYDSESRGNGIDCRLINADEVANTLRDYCNGVDKTTPIAVLSSVPIVVNKKESINNVSNQQVELYTGKGSHRVKWLNIKYIKTPNIVKYDNNLNKCVNCDLPDFVHYDIVKLAVNEFYTSIYGKSTNNDKLQTLKDIINK